jgi:superfamily II DNA or RNA helicase
VTVEDVFDQRPAPVLDLELSPCRSTEGLQATVRFEYEGRAIPASSEQTTVELLEGTRLRKFHRNKIAEAEALDLLKAVGFVRPSVETGAGTATVPGVWAYRPPGSEAADEARVLPKAAGGPGAEASLTEGLRTLEQNGWRLTWERSRELTALAEEAWYTGLTSGEWNWFEFEAGIEVNGNRINLLPVLHGLLQRFRGWSLARIRQRLLTEPVCVPIAEGRVGIVPGRRLWRVVEQLFELMDDAPLGSNQRLALDGLRTAEIMELEEFATEPWETTRQVRRLMELLRRGLELRPHPAPPGLRTELRPYQQEGLAWLQLLREYEMDGILADDMGLGKTVQALAHLLVEKDAGRLAQPCLIVSPTSVLSNWAAELERHAPGLTWMILHGNERSERFAKLGSVDVALTTYPLLYRDAERYRERTFSYVILDEAQFIKNARSQAAQVVSRLAATRRLCLTGTPLENHLGELWALFHFLMPGFLGDPRAFKSRFRDPELLPEMLAEGRRVLLFSQFTSMLTLIEAELKKRDLKWVKLTGQSQKRDDRIIDRFTSGQVPLFLISLKAGGVGLNLPQADTVIHYDPWWNPAVENQATDRAHRIGQDKPVFVYKLMTEGTVEAKIQQLQEKKRRLVEGILAGSLKGRLAFTESDLAMLLEPVRSVTDSGQ